MDFPVESYSFLPGSRAILDLSYRSRLRWMSQQSRPTMSMVFTLDAVTSQKFSVRHVGGVKERETILFVLLCSDYFAIYLNMPAFCPVLECPNDK